MAIDANDVTATFTVIMALAACASVVYAYKAVQKSKAANVKATTANTLAESANETAEQAFKNSQGDSEILIHTSLSDALRRQDESFVKLIEAKEKYGDDEEHFAIKAYTLLSDSAVQGYLNAFDIVCQRYLDGKLDKNRFKKTYSSRIKELFDENKGYKMFLREISSTKYHALHLVNSEFHNLEQSRHSM